MKAREFKLGVEKLGFEFHENYHCFSIVDQDGDWVAEADKEEVYIFSVENYSFLELVKTEPEKAEKLFNLCVEFARTPINERADERYYIKHKWISFYRLGKLEPAYLNFLKEQSMYTLQGKENIDEYQTLFTLSEIEEIKEAKKSELKDYELVEAETIE